MKRFLGHEISRDEHRQLMAVISRVHQMVGKSKKDIKTEADFWGPLEQVFGLTPFAGDPFMVSVRRMAPLVRRMSTDERRAAAVAVGLLPSDFPPHVRAQRAQAALKPDHGPSIKSKAKFYASWDWRTLRMKVLKEQGRSCQCCGAAPGQIASSGEAVRIVVDHIKPISKFWELRLERSNLQVLWDECNQGKGAWDETDWRGPNVIPFSGKAAA